jgi:hypothetical protein
VQPVFEPHFWIATGDDRASGVGERYQERRENAFSVSLTVGHRPLLVSAA